MLQPLARVVGKTWVRANSRRHQTAFQTSVRAPGLQGRRLRGCFKDVWGNGDLIWEEKKFNRNPNDKNLGLKTPLAEEG